MGGVSLQGCVESWSGARLRGQARVENPARFHLGMPGWRNPDGWMLAISWKNMSEEAGLFSRDFFLALPNCEGTGIIGAMGKYYHASQMSQAMLAELVVSQRRQDELEGVGRTGKRLAQPGPSIRKENSAGSTTPTRLTPGPSGATWRRCRGRWPKTGNLEGADKLDSQIGRSDACSPCNSCMRKRLLSSGRTRAGVGEPLESSGISSSGAATFRLEFRAAAWSWRAVHLNAAASGPWIPTSVACWTSRRCRQMRESLWQLDGGRRWAGLRCWRMTVVVSGNCAGGSIQKRVERCFSQAGKRLDACQPVGSCHYWA